MTIPRGTPIEKLHHHAQAPCPKCDVRALIADQGSDQWECVNCDHIIQLERPLPMVKPEDVEWADYSEVVYYIRFGTRVKIGTSRNLKRRLLVLPHDEVMATEPGTYDLEGRRHRQFRLARVAGQREWFHLTPELKAHIEGLRA